MKNSPPPHPNMVSVETSMFNAEYLKQNKKEINWKLNTHNLTH